MHGRHWPLNAPALLPARVTGHWECPSRGPGAGHLGFSQPGSGVTREERKGGTEQTQPAGQPVPAGVVADS